MDTIEQIKKNFELGSLADDEPEVKIPTAISEFHKFQTVDAIRKSRQAFDINFDEDETLSKLKDTGGISSTTALFDEAGNGADLMPLGEAMSLTEFKQHPHYRRVHEIITSIHEDFLSKASDMKATKDVSGRNQDYALGVQTVLDRLGSLFSEAEERKANATTAERARMGADAIKGSKTSTPQPQMQKSITPEENHRRATELIKSLGPKNSLL